MKHLTDKILILVCKIGTPFLCLVMGRFLSPWFPFRLTKKVYLPIKNVYFQKLLISDETHVWGRTRPEQLQYYCVSPENRGKMCIWGLLFYLDVCLMLIFGTLMKHGIFLDGSRRVQLILFLVLMMLPPVESLDFLIGVQQSMNAEQLYFKRLTGLLVTNIILMLWTLCLCIGFYMIA